MGASGSGTAKRFHSTSSVLYVYVDPIYLYLSTFSLFFRDLSSLFLTEQVVQGRVEGREFVRGPSDPARRRGLSSG